MTAVDICRMMKRRLKAAGLPGQFSPHSFRVATVTDLLEQNVPLENVQHLAGHADPRTTRLYDRRRRKVTRNIVERISTGIIPALGRQPDKDPRSVSKSSCRYSCAH
jgi:site-specific recombinase XerD